MADALAPLGAPKFANSQQLADDLATKEQLQSTRDYAKALLMGSGQQPVHHWTQGVSNMVSALMGGALDYNAAQKEKALKNEAGLEADPFGAGAPSQPLAAKTSFDGAPPSGGQQTAEGGLSPEIDKYITDAAQKYGVDPAYLRKTAMIESSGNPRDVNPRSGAAGLFQFVHGTANQYGLKDPLDPAANTDAAARFTADNMKQLTQALGRPPTPGELYLAHQQGVGGAIKLLTNPGAPAVSSVGLGAVMNNGGAKSMTGQQFANMWTSRFPGAAPVALPNSGSIQPAMNLTSSAQPNTAQTTAAVLRGDEQPQAEPVAQRGATPGITQALPQPQGGQQPIVPPGLVPHPPHWSPQQFRRGIVNDYLPDTVKAAMLNGYLTQHQPVEIPVAGGKVIASPDNPLLQMPVPDVKWGEEKMGDFGRQVPQYVDPRFGVVRPGSNPPTAAPAASPAAAPVQAAPQGGATVEAGAPQNAPAAPAGPAKATPVVAGEGGEGPLGGLKANIPPAPSGIPKDLWEANYMKKAADTAADVNKDARLKAADLATKRVVELNTQAQEFRKQKPNLDLALQLMNDPNFHSGLASGAQDVWSRFKALFGDKYANASNETFDKVIASNMMSQLKMAFGGLGQIRNMEMLMLGKASASRYNTVASNRAVIELTRRAGDQIDRLDQMAQQYQGGEEVRDPVTDEVLMKPNVGADGNITPRNGWDASFSKLARNFLENHPTMTEDEIKRYNTIFDTGEDPNEKQAATPGQSGEGPGVKAPGGAPASAATTQAGQTYKGYTFKGGDYRDKNNWTKAQ